MAKTCLRLPMGATPNRLAHMSNLVHMGTAKRLQRVLAPFADVGPLRREGEPFLEEF